MIAGKIEQPTTDTILASAKEDASQSFKSHVEYAKKKVRIITYIGTP